MSIQGINITFLKILKQCKKLRQTKEFIEKVNVSNTIFTYLSRFNNMIYDFIELKS